MKKIVVLATAGAGGDLQFLVAVALGYANAVMNLSFSETRQWRQLSPTWV